MKYLITWFFLVSKLFLCLNTTSQAQEKWQTWYSQSIRGDLSEELQFSVTLESRFKEGSLYYQGKSLTLLNRLSEKSHLEIGAKHIFSKNNSQWTDSADLYTGVIFKGTWNNIDISNRNRLEYRIPNNYFRYRNKLTFSLQSNTSPYIAGELYYNINGSNQGYKRIRGWIGVKGKFCDNINWDIYKMKQTDIKVDDRFSVFGTSLSVRF